jgi:hypothetical protein
MSADQPVVITPVLTKMTTPARPVKIELKTKHFILFFGKNQFELQSTQKNDKK